MLSFFINLDLLQLFIVFYLLTPCILNDHVLNFYLIGRAVDHVFDEEFPVTQLADETSLPLLVTFLLLRSEFFLRLCVHIAKGTVIPGAAIGDLQDQRSPFRRWAENGFYIIEKTHHGCFCSSFPNFTASKQ